MTIAGEREAADLERANRVLGQLAQTSLGAKIADLDREAMFEPIRDELTHFPLFLRRPYAGNPAHVDPRGKLFKVHALTDDGRTALGYWDHEAVSYVRKGQPVTAGMSRLPLMADDVRAMYRTVLERREQREIDDARGGSGLRAHVSSRGDTR